MIKTGIITFFYIDNIIFCHRIKYRDKVDIVISGLEIKYIFIYLEELYWFLGIHMVWNRTKQTFWLS